MFSESFEGDEVITSYQPHQPDELTQGDFGGSNSE
jgi:hypothetical protein